MSLDLPADLELGAAPTATAGVRRPARWSIQSPLTGVMWGAAALIWIGTAVAVLPAGLRLAVFAASFAVFTAPGWPLARWLLGRRAPLIVTAPVALLLGYAAGITIYLLLRLAGAALPIFAGAASAAVTVLLAGVLPAREDGLIEVPATDRRDGLALGALLVVVGLVIGPVFAHVGAATTAGLAYRAYFIADLFAHMSVVAELVKGVTPPLNPYFPTEPLPYYWSFFSFPTLFSLLQPGLPVDRGILLTDLAMAAVYVATWYTVLRLAGFSALASAAAWIVAIVASSFEGIYYVVEQGRGWTGFRYLNVDALTRWRWDLPPVDGLHRLFWYTPQHGLALTLGLLAIAVGASVRAAALRVRGAIEGWLLAIALACSSFNGLLHVGAYALAETTRLATARLRGVAGWLTARAIAAGIVLAGLGLILALGIIQRNAGEVILGFNRHLLRGPWAFLALSFGAPLVLAPFGARHLWRTAPRLTIGLGALAVVSVAAFLLVDVRGHENTYVSFRTAQFLYCVLAAGTAAAIDAARAWPRARRAAFAALATVATLAALPTVVLDTYNAQDITNVEMSVGGFPWTVHVTPAEQEALAWVRTHLPHNTVVQMDPLAHGRATWALLPAFGERRVGVGLALFEPNPRRFSVPMTEARAIFWTPDPAAAFALCERYGIRDLWIGPEERAAHGASLDKFAREPAHFTRTYAASGIEIYHVRFTPADMERSR